MVFCRFVDGQKSPPKYSTRKEGNEGKNTLITEKFDKFRVFFLFIH